MLALNLEGFHPPLPSLDHPLQSLGIPSSARLCGLCCSAFSFPSSFTLSLFCKKNKKITSLFSNSSALFKKERFGNSFSINTFRTLLQNTEGGAPPPKNPPTISRFLRSIRFGITFFADPRPLTLIESNSYKKHGVGGLDPLFSSASETEPQHPRVTLGGVPFSECPCGGEE
jgi:hypothetical protein